MEKKLDAKELRPNSLYQVTITLDSGDKVIDSLRSFTTEVPKIFTTDISTTMTTSSLIPVKQYSNYKAKAATPGDPISVRNVDLGTATITAASSSKPFSKKIYNSAFYPMNVFIKASGLPDTSTLLTLAVTSPGWNWLSGSYVVTPNSADDFTISSVFTPAIIEPGLSWQVTGSGMATSGYWSVPFPSPLDSINKEFNVSGRIYWTDTAAYKAPTAAVYEDRVAISNTIKTSITNSDILSALSWEEDIVKDVPFFFFSDKAGTVANTDYLYMYESSSLSGSAFVAGSPLASNKFTPAKGLTLLAQKNPPAYDETKQIFGGLSPTTSNDLVVFKTATAIAATGYGYPTKMQVVYSVARYIKQTNGSWTGSWIQKDENGYPVLSTAEVITGV